jgi:hypothetical protein
MDTACIVGIEGYPAVLRIRRQKSREEEGTHDVSVKNDLLHYVCVIREKKVDAMLKIVVKI